jgi:uncharacterized protein
MDYECFLCSEFDQWAHHDIGKLNVQFFAEATLVWGDGIANLCWMASAGGRVLVVEHDGSVYSCDHFIRPEHQVGDLGNFDLGELVNTPIHRDFGTDRRYRLPDQCRYCRWFTICNGGCPKDRFAMASRS